MSPSGDPVPSRSSDGFGNPGLGRVVANSTSVYTRVQIALHWLVAVLVIEQYGTSGAIVRTHTVHMIGQRQSPTDLVLHVMHNRLGLVLTGVMVVRLAYRSWVGAPTLASEAAGRSWPARIAATVHAAFYVVLICEGIAGAVASYLWWPASVLHVVLFKVLLGLVGLHVAAVVLHHLTGTAILGRMGLPWPPAFPRAAAASRKGSSP